MDTNDRPQGRQKRVGTGGGGVFRRGDGLSGKTGGPVGDAGGYAGRTEGASDGQQKGVTPAPGGTSSGGAGRPSIGCSPKLLLILIVVVAIIAVIAWIASRSGGDGGNSPLDSGSTGTSGLTSATSIAPSTTVDTGATTVATSVSQQARAKRTVLKGNGNDTVTIMVYMCATDLESQSGMATADLNEMLYAQDSDKLNVVVETGGTSQWRNSVISATTNQRYRVTAKGLELIQDALGRRSMVDPGTLADFIQYTKAKYPADRYMLVLWDHGGGSLTGYGYDQNFKNDSMTLDELSTALKNGGCVFDVIGFDACLMSTLETAVALEPYADYMIASEETEPGIGWYYTGWLSTLAGNTSTATTELGKKLIDDYIAQCRTQTPQNQATLTLIDLAELKGTVPSAFAAFANSMNGLIDANDYKTVSDARADAKEFASAQQINQVDLIDFAQNLGSTEAAALITALQGCIKYNRATANISNANGMSVFFPYERLSQLNAMLSVYDRVGVSAEYGRCVRSFASVAAGGQVTSSGSGNILDILLGGLAGGQSSGAGSSGSGASLGGTVGSLLESFLKGGDFSSITGLVGSAGWLDTDKMRAYQSYYETNRFDAAALQITTKDSRRVLTLSAEQWALVQRLEQNVFVDDGEGFIDLGLDNVVEYTPAGDLVMEYDGTWLALNGHVVSYYLMSEDRDGESYCIKGRVPALLNGQLVDIILVFDNENPYGVVLGAQPKYDTETQTGTVAKGLLDIVAGDAIDYLCDYYSYDGTYSDTYYLGEQYTATGEWQIENLPVGGKGYQMTYRLTDIYGNQYWTPSVSG